jgi:hypothetical protein
MRGPSTAHLSHSVVCRAENAPEESQLWREAGETRRQCRVETLPCCSQPRELYETNHVADDGECQQAGLRRSVGSVKAHHRNKRERASFPPTEWRETGIWFGRRAHANCSTVAKPQRVSSF